MMNKFLSVVLKESVLQAPFASNPKCDVIDAAASVIGSIFGFGSQADANRTNKEIAEMNIKQQQETNKQNYQMFKEQQQYALDQWNREAAWNEEMWNKNNLYNSPSQLRQRLQAAGINPASVFGSGSVTPASQMSAPSGATPSGSPAIAPHNDYKQVPYFPDLSGVGGLTTALLNNRLLSEEIKKRRSETHHNDIANLLDEQSLKYDLIKRINDSKLTKVQRMQAEKDLEFLNEVFEYRVGSEKWLSGKAEKDVKMMELQIIGQKITNDILSTNEKWQERLNSASYRSLNANIQNALSAANLNDAKAVESAASKALIDLQSAGVKLDNQQKSDLHSAIVDKAWSEADEAFWRSGSEEKRYRGGLGYYGIPVTPSDERRHENSRRSNSSRNRIRDKSVELTW